MSTSITRAQTSLEYYLDITPDEVVAEKEAKPKWRTIYCTPNMHTMSINIGSAWQSLSKLFLKQAEYESNDNQKRWKRYASKSLSIEILIKAWSCVIGAQCILRSCQQQQQLGTSSECDHRPVVIPVGLKTNFNFNRNTHKLFRALQLVMSQYGKVFDGIQQGHFLALREGKNLYKIKEVLEPFDVEADVRALIRLAAQLLVDFDEDNPQINKNYFSRISPEFPIKMFTRAWLPSTPNDGRFQLIMACAIGKLVNTSLDLSIRPLELVQAFRSNTKTKPNWWKYLKEQLPEPNRDKLDFLFTDWTEHDLVHNLGNASDVLALLQLEWHEPSVDHLAFGLNLDRELKSIEKKLKLLDRFLLIGKQKDFHPTSLKVCTYAGSWAQISYAFYNVSEFYRKLKNSETLGLAYNFPPFTISEYNFDISFSEQEQDFYPRTFKVSNKQAKNFKNYLGLSPTALYTKSNTAFLKPIYFTPCIPTLYRNLEEAWKVAFPKHLAKSRIPVDSLERALRRHVMAAGLLVCAYSICQSCLDDDDGLPIKRSVQSFVIHLKFFFYRHPLDDERLRLFSSVFEIAAQYGRVWCNQTGQDLLPVSMEFVVHALVRIATQLTRRACPHQFEVFHSGNPSTELVKNKLELSDEQIPQVMARSWLPTILCSERATDCRFLFLLARQIDKFLASECGNCISPMKFVKFVHDNSRYKNPYDSVRKQQDQRPKWWQIFLDKLPQSCRDRLEFIFYSFNHQTFIDNLGDETGKQLLTLLGLEWDNPQEDHLTDYMSHYDLNYVHECFKNIDQLIKTYIQYENREEKDGHFIHLKRLEHGHRGSWAQLSDPLMDGSEQNTRLFHRVIDNAKYRALANKYPPVVLYEYVNNRAYV